MPPYFFYTMVRKSKKMTKNSNQRGSCLKTTGVRPIGVCEVARRAQWLKLPFGRQGCHRLEEGWGFLQWMGRMLSLVTG